MKIKKNQWVIIISFLIFVISYFLPAYHGGLGYECAQFCLLEIWDHQDIFLSVIYYFVFNITNLVMIIVPILIVCGYYHKVAPRKIRLWLLIVYTLLFLHVLSWWVIHFFSKEGIPNIQIGYYLWAFSIGLFTFMAWKEKNMFK